MLNSREAVRNVPAYHPPLAGRIGLRLDFNENTAGCSPRVLDQLRRTGFEDLARYPDRKEAESTAASFLGILQEETLLTNGVDEAIHLLCQTYLDTGDEALIVVPTYSMYRIYAMTAGARVIEIPTPLDFAFPAEQLERRITQRTRLIAIANPNNPTGTVVSDEILLQIARAATDAAVLIDEAYFEFYGQTLLRRWRELPNLFVGRTFSKAYGMAGLRLGMLAGDPEQMRFVRRVCSPYNVNAVALACLPEALADREFVELYAQEILQSRRSLEAVLAASGIQYWPSQANFVLVRIGSESTDASAFVELMRQRGILVRDRSADYGCRGCVRITVGPREQNQRLLAALHEVLSELGMGQGAAR